MLRCCKAPAHPAGWRLQRGPATGSMTRAPMVIDMPAQPPARRIGSPATPRARSRSAAHNARRPRQTIAAAAKRLVAVVERASPICSSCWSFRHRSLVLQTSCLLEPTDHRVEAGIVETYTSFAIVHRDDARLEQASRIGCRTIWSTRLPARGGRDTASHRPRRPCYSGRMEGQARRSQRDPE